MYRIKEIVLLVAILALGQANVIEVRNSRIYGSFNKYYFYNRYLINPVIIASGDIATVAAPLNAERETVLIAHDGLGSHGSTVNSYLKDAFLNISDYDIIVLDWEHVATLGDSLVTALPTVAQDVAKAINTFFGAGTVAYNNLHMIGHGDGAHLVGMVGRLLNEPAARITGLNPTGGKWETSNNRLIRTDAYYVETIRTDVNGSRAVGTTLSTGHVDIYPNGGTRQPGCLNNACNHDRAYSLFAASLTTGGLMANLCTDLTEMSRNRCTGLVVELGTAHLIKWATGIFRVNTGSEYPFVLKSVD